MNASATPHTPDNIVWLQWFIGLRYNTVLRVVIFIIIVQ